MAQFISKQQYKNYEKGEFADEERRSLDDTIALIKNFPWASERGADIQLTGPSVTIWDENDNYLKVALYFNGKFCLYYLDGDNHLYEYHATDLPEVYNMVNDFFVGQLPVEKFDKHLLGIGSRGHFESASFEYTLKNAPLMVYFFPSLIGLAIVVFGTFTLVVTKGMPWPMIFFGIFFNGIVLLSLYAIFKSYSYAKNRYLNISKGHDEFQYGKGDEIRVYNKKDISLVNVYGGYRSSIVNLIEIVFRDGSAIKIPGIIIDLLVLREKLPAVSFNIIEGYFRRLKKMNDPA